MNQSVVQYPEEFENFSDREKVDWLADNFPPDSLAVILIDSAIEDSVQPIFQDHRKSVLYAYEGYDIKSRVEFGERLNEYCRELPLAKRIIVYSKLGKESPKRLGIMMAKESQGNENDSIGWNEVIRVMDSLEDVDSNFRKRFENGWNINLEF